MNFTAKLALGNVLMVIVTVQLFIAKELISTFDWDGFILVVSVTILGLLVFLFAGNEN